MQITINNKTYIVEDSEEGYKVTFPEGFTINLDIYHDQNQEISFAFELKLAQELGEEIVRKTM